MQEATAIASLPDLSPETLTRLERISDRSERVRAAVRAPRTLLAYRSDWRQFVRWADDLGLSVPHDPEALAAPLPVGVVEAYLLERTDPGGDSLSAASAARHLAAIRWWHHRSGLQSPTDHP